MTQGLSGSRAPAFCRPTHRELCVCSVVSASATLWSPPGSSVQEIFQARPLDCHALLPGMEPTSPASPALSDGLFTTEPPGEPTGGYART